MADDDSRSEDAEKRPGKSSKPSKKPETGKDAKARRKRDDDKPAKSGKSDKDAKDDKSAKAEKSDKDKAVKTAAKSEKDDKPKKRRGLGTFLREIFEQLRKVVYPTRKQLLTYTAVVLIFVTIMIGVIYGLDYVMSKGVTWVFGGNEK